MACAADGAPAMVGWYSRFSSLPKENKSVYYALRAPASAFGSKAS